MSAEVKSDIEQAVRSMQRGADPEESAGRLYEYCFPPVHRFFLRRGFEQGAAVDLAQDVLLRVYRGIGGFGFDASFDGWMFDIVESVWKDQPPPEEPAIPAAEQPEPGGGPELEIAAAVGDLPGRMRQCILLRFGQGIEEPEIAALLKIRPGTVTSQLRNGERRLRPFLPGLPKGPESAEGEAGSGAERELTEGVRRAMAAARDRLREPPTPDDLIGYVDGAQTVPERRRIEDWIVSDPAMAQTVLDLRTFPALPFAGEDPTDAERGAAWETMRERLSAEGLLPAGMPRRTPAPPVAIEPVPVSAEPPAPPIAADESAEEEAPAPTPETPKEVSERALITLEPEPEAPEPASLTGEGELADFEPTVAAALPAPAPAVAEAELESQEQEPAPPQPTPNPAARWGSGHVERVRPAVPRWAPPLAALLAATTLGLAAFLGWLYFTGQVGAPAGPSAAPVEAPRLNPLVRTLLPADTTPEGAAGVAGVVAVAKAAEALVLVLGPSAAAEFPAYRVEVYDAAGKRIFARDGLVRLPDGTFTVDFPRPVLASGRYRIVVVGVGDAGQRPLAIYDLALAVE